MFSKKDKRTSLGGDSSREAVTASLRPREAPHYARTAMREGGKLPEQNIGVSKLLEVYDDYPIVLDSLERTTVRMEAAEEAAHEAERKRDEVQADLDEERKLRQKDAADAAEDKRRSVISKEKAVRDELDPKIKDLTNRLAQVTKDRDGLQKEIADRKREMKTWIDGMQRLHAERANAAERERKAVEDKKSVDDRLKDLDKTILDGLKKATGAATVSDAAAFASDTRATATAKPKAWEEKSDRPRFVEHNDPTTPVTPKTTRAWDSDYVHPEDQEAMANPEPKVERESTSTRKSIAAEFARRKSVKSSGSGAESPAPVEVTSPRKSIAPDTPATKTAADSEKNTPARPSNSTRRKSSFSTSKKNKDEFGSALDDMLAGKLGKS